MIWSFINTQPGLQVKAHVDVLEVAITECFKFTETNEQSYLGEASNQNMSKLWIQTRYSTR